MAPDTVSYPRDCQQDSILISVPLDTMVPADSAHYRFGRVTAAAMPLAGQIANLPEFHDCQRFMVESDQAPPVASFGPLVAIWAAAALDTRFPPAPPVVQAVPVAVIYNFDGPRYDPLDLNQGFSCLYMWKANTWQARVVGLGASPSLPIPCLDAIDTTDQRIAQGGILEVKPDRMPPGLPAADIPPVARWNWDEAHKWQYIGIRCGTEWCEIGPPHFVPSNNAQNIGMTVAKLKSITRPIPGIGSAADPRGRPAEILRVVSVSGWYDQQELDLTNPGGKPRPARSTGTVFPHPALARAPFTPGKWTPVAYIDASANYTGKVPLTTGISQVSLCPERAPGECAGTTGMTCAPEPFDPADPTAPLYTWWTQIEHEKGSKQVYCAKRRRHHGMAIPAAAARWNWNELDAKTWTLCGSPACCTGN
jgi:hypothetical protein